MTTNLENRAGCSRAAASVVFAGVSLLLWSDYARFHGLWWAGSLRGTPEGDRVGWQSVLVHHAVAYQLLAAASVIWCIWSWLREPPSCATIATIPAVIAGWYATVVFL